MWSIWCILHINKIDTVVKVFFLIFFKLGQHGAYQVKLFPSEVIDSSNGIAVILKAGLNSEINTSYIFILCMIILI